MCCCEVNLISVGIENLNFEQKWITKGKEGSLSSPSLLCHTVSWFICTYQTRNSFLIPTRLSAPIEINHWTFWTKCTFIFPGNDSRTPSLWLCTGETMFASKTLDGISLGWQKLHCQSIGQLGRNISVPRISTAKHGKYFRPTNDDGTGHRSARFTDQKY